MARVEFNIPFVDGGSYMFQVCMGIEEDFGGLGFRTLNPQPGVRARENPTYEGLGA